MSVTLRQLRAFVAVAESRSFTEAAQQLNLTQSALSVMVRELEGKLGVRLFDRHTRGVSMTDAGVDLQPRVIRMLVELGDAMQSVADLGARKRGIVRLAAPQLIASAVLPGVIAMFRDLYPGIDVRLSDTMPEHLLEGLVTGAVDLAFGHELAHDASVSGTVLLEDPFLLVCRPDHPLARRRRVRWQEVVEHPFIGPTRDFRQRLMPELDADARARLASPAPHEVSYLTTALGLVLAGLGVTASPSYAAPLVAAYGLKLIPVDTPVFRRKVSVYQATRRSLSPAAVAFADELRRHVKKMPKWRP